MKDFIKFAIVLIAIVFIVICFTKLPETPVRDLPEKYAIELEQISEPVRAEMINVLDNYIVNEEVSDERYQVIEYSTISFPSVESKTIEADNKTYYEYHAEQGSGLFDEGCTYIYTKDDNTVYLTFVANDYFYQYEKESLDEKYETIEARCYVIGAVAILLCIVILYLLESESN